MCHKVLNSLDMREVLGNFLSFWKNHKICLCFPISIFGPFFPPFGVVQSYEDTPPVQPRYLVYSIVIKQRLSKGNESLLSLHEHNKYNICCTANISGGISFLNLFDVILWSILVDVNILIMELNSKYVMM